MNAMWYISFFGFIFIKFYLRHLPGDVFMHTVEAAAADFIGTVLIGVFHLRYDLRLSFMFCYIISAICGLVLWMGTFEENPVVFGVFLFFGSFGVSAAYLLCLVGAVTLFPTNVKASSYGIGNMVSRLAGMTAPLFVDVTLYDPLLVFVLLNILGIWLAYLLDVSKPKENKN